MASEPDRYQQIYALAIKAYPQDSKSTVQKKACNLWKLVKEGEKKDKSATIFEKTMAKLRQQTLESKSKATGFWASLKTKVPEKQALPFNAIETNTVENAIQVEDGSTAPESNKDSATKTGHKKDTPAQNKLRTELEEINSELASYSCIREKTGLSEEYKERVKLLTSQKDEAEKKLKRKIKEAEKEK